MIGFLEVVIGLVAIMVATFSWKPKKEKWSILATFALIGVGSYYIFTGLPRLSDPPSQLEVTDYFELIAGAAAIGKALNWIVMRTDFYKTLLDALKSIPEIKRSVSEIESKVKEK